MDPNENTKSGPEQDQCPGPPDSASQAEEPGDTKAESPRKCSICGGPNHYGCGCEARAAKIESDKQSAENKQIAAGGPAAGQPKAKIDTVDSPSTETDDDLEDILSAKALREAHDATMNMVKDIKTMNERSGAICDCLFDLCQYFKVVSEDLKTIKEVLIKKDEVKKNAS